MFLLITLIIYILYRKREQIHRIRVIIHLFTWYRILTLFSHILVLHV